MILVFRTFWNISISIIRDIYFRKKKKADRDQHYYPPKKQTFLLTHNCQADWMDSGANSVIKCKEGLLTTPSELFTNVGKFRGSRDPREGGKRDTTPDCQTTHSLCFWPYSLLRYGHATPHCQHPHSGIQKRGTRTSLGNLYTQTDEKIKTRKSQGKHEGYFCNWGLSYNEHNV